eukprot:14057643-Ditylum_brightwellii.AAC.1
MIATVLEKAPKEYGTVLTVEQRTQGGGLTLAHLQEAMTQLWRTLYGGENENDDKNEMGLAIADITCYRCGKKGHKGYQCNKKTRGKKGEGNREKCDRCGKKATQQPTASMTQRMQVKGPIGIASRKEKGGKWMKIRTKKAK